MQEELLEFVGFGFIELVGELLEHREPLCRAYELDRLARAGARAAHVPGPSIEVTSEAGKAEAKALERLRRKFRETDMIGLSTTKHFAAQRTHGADDNSAEAVLRAASGNPSAVFPHVFKAARPGGPASSMYQSKLALPAGTQREDTAHFEEFTIPHSSRLANPRADAIEIISVSQMDELSRKAFPPPYTALNRMQSAVYPVAFGTRENMLVCAPTGAGKTDVAMLAVLRTVHDHVGTAGSILRGAFKIVYVAPMKALAAEVAAKFSSRLAKLGLAVREYTGDMQLSRKEIAGCQMIVTTPEKWDVVTRKAHGDTGLAPLVRLLIIDEVHLLQDDRGPVLEAIVARTLRAVEMSQRPVRIVGLSATLPNYVDVASFLRVSPQAGMFYFDEGFRPVPLTQHLVGIKGASSSQARERMNTVCYGRVRAYVEAGHQVMVFVHSRAETVATAKALIRQAREENALGLFTPSSDDADYARASLQVSKQSRNRELQDLFRDGFGMHHAGMLRPDRSLVEALFSGGHIRVLCCTATLAWGVNLPAHAVIIKGTQVYDSQRGGFVPLGILDVLQIFGRAGRPQYETHGEATILTPHGDLAHYLSALLAQVPIESRFTARGHLVNNLNAEIALGTVTCLREAVSWLGYTYLTIRMQRNPTAYGLTPKQLLKDPLLEEHLTQLVRAAASQLRAAGMIAFDNDAEGRMISRDVGRIASAYYVGLDTVEAWGRVLSPSATEETLLAAVSSSAEFDSLRVRQEELEELDGLDQLAGHLRHRHEMTSTAGKTATLIQAAISRCPVASFSLSSDMHYIAQNAGRVIRAAFEMLRTQGWARAARAALSLAKAFEQRHWMHEQPIAQLLTGKIPPEAMAALGGLSVEELCTLSAGVLEKALKGKHVGRLGPMEAMAKLIRDTAARFPRIAIEAVSLKPVGTGRVVQADITIAGHFRWDAKAHGDSLHWWLWAETVDGETLLKETCEEVRLAPGDMARSLSLYIPTPLPPRLMLRATSDRWLGSDQLVELPLKDFIPVAPDPTVSTPLVDGQAETPAQLEGFLAARGIASLTRIQGAVLDRLLSAQSVFVAAPKGAGHRLLAEVVLWKHRQGKDGLQAVYLVPSRVLAEERYAAWRDTLCPALDISIALHSGDADLIVSDLAAWRHARPSSRPLLILEHLEMLAEPANSIAFETLAAAIDTQATRVVALSMPVQNPADLAHALRIPDVLAFGQQHRAPPLQIRIQGVPERSQAARMAAMERPIYQAIREDASAKPVLVWCPSRRQALLTAQALLAFAANDDVHFGSIDAAGLVRDQAVKDLLAFGLAAIHAGTADNDRRACLDLFTAGTLRILIATVDTALPALHAPLVILKGTEDAHHHHHHHQEELPLHRLLQLVEGAGRPSADAIGTAVLLTRDIRKPLYRALLADPPTIESSLHKCVEPFLLMQLTRNGPMAIAQCVTALRDSTLLGRRLQRNPMWYGCTGTSSQAILDETLWSLAQRAFDCLLAAGLVGRGDGGFRITELGIEAQAQSISPQTVSILRSALHADAEPSLPALLRTLALATEFDQIRLSNAAELAQSAGIRPALCWLHGLPKDHRGPVRMLDDPELPSTKALLSILEHMGGKTGRATQQVVGIARRILALMLKLALDSSRLSLVKATLCLSQALAEPLVPWPDAKPPTSCPKPTMLVKVTRSAGDKGEGVKSMAAGQPYHLKCNITTPAVGDGDWFVLLSQGDTLLASHKISADAWPSDSNLVIAVPFKAPEKGDLQVSLLSCSHFQLEGTHTIRNS